MIYWSSFPDNYRSCWWDCDIFAALKNHQTAAKSANHSPPAEEKTGQRCAAVAVVGMFKLVAWFVFVLWSSKPCPVGTTPSDAQLTTTATLAKLHRSHFREASWICMSAFSLVKEEVTCGQGACWHAPYFYIFISYLSACVFIIHDSYVTF